MQHNHHSQRTMSSDAHSLPGTPVFANPDQDDREDSAHSYEDMETQRDNKRQRAAPEDALEDAPEDYRKMRRERQLETEREMLERGMVVSVRSGGRVLYKPAPKPAEVIVAESSSDSDSDNEVSAPKAAPKAAPKPAESKSKTPKQKPTREDKAAAAQKKKDIIDEAADAVCQDPALECRRFDLVPVVGRAERWMIKFSNAAIRNCLTTPAGTLSELLGYVQLLGNTQRLKAMCVDAVTVSAQSTLASFRGVLQLNLAGLKVEDLIKYFMVVSSKKLTAEDAKMLRELELTLRFAIANLTLGLQVPEGDIIAFMCAAAVAHLGSGCTFTVVSTSISCSVEFPIEGSIPTAVTGSDVCVEKLNEVIELWHSSGANMRALIATAPMFKSEPGRVLLARLTSV